MQRKPAHPACSIKVPESGEEVAPEPEEDGERRCQQLLSFAHARWGFDNWSWAVTRQDLDFVDYCNGKYSVGVVSYVKIHVKSLDVYRENIGYASCVAVMKGSAIHQARKCAVTNALRETLLSFGGTVTGDLLELLEAGGRREITQSALSPAARPYEPTRTADLDVHNKRRSPPDPAPVPPVARAHPMPACRPVVTPAPAPAAATPVAPQLPAPAPAPKPNDMKRALPPVAADDEEARADRKRRQRLAQEHFRHRHLGDHN